MRALIVAAALAASVLAARAAEVDFNVQLKEMDSSGAVDCNKVDQRQGACLEVVPLTLKRLVVAALDSPDANTPAMEKLRRGMLAQRVYRAEKAVELTAEEVQLVKDLIAKLNVKPSLIFQAYELLDPASVKKQ